MALSEKNCGCSERIVTFDQACGLSPIISLIPYIPDVVRGIFIKKTVMFQLENQNVCYNCAILLAVNLDHKTALRLGPMISTYTQLVTS